MTIYTLMILCTLLLLAYVFDLTSSKTKIPTVIVLLALGFFTKMGAQFFEFPIPDLTTFLPVLGTVGLIFIVLEGTLELELKKSTLPLIKSSFLMALVPMIVIAFGLALAFHLIEGESFKLSLTNAIPFCIISSAIAIPSVAGWKSNKKGFVIYESSLSDIFGVILFNFLHLMIILEHNRLVFSFLN